MLHTTALVMFESNDSPAVLSDPANREWVAVVAAVSGESFEILTRRYYMALYHFRRQQRRSPLPGRTEVSAKGRKGALQGMLDLLTARRASPDAEREGGKSTFVNARPDQTDKSMPEALRDFTKAPAPLHCTLSGQSASTLHAVSNVFAAKSDHEILGERAPPWYSLPVQWTGMGMFIRDTLPLSGLCLAFTDE